MSVGTTLKRDTAAFFDLSRELLEAGHAVRFRADGSSMRPAIHDGDALIVEPVDREAVKAGDILLFRHDQRLLAHRVINIRQANGTIVQFEVRGDAKAERECLVKAEDVLGRVTLTERQSGWRRITGRCGARRLRQVVRFMSSPGFATRHHALAPRAKRHT